MAQKREGKEKERKMWVSFSLFFSTLTLSKKKKKKKKNSKSQTFRRRPPGAPGVQIGLDLRLDHLRGPQVRDAEHKLEDAVSARDDGDLKEKRGLKYKKKKKKVKRERE